MGLAAYLKLGFFLFLIIVDWGLSLGLRIKARVGYWYSLVLTIVRNLRMAFFLIGISDLTFIGIRTASRLSIQKIQRLDALLAYLFVILMGAALLWEFLAYFRLAIDESYIVLFKRIQRKKTKLKKINSRQILPETNLSKARLKNNRQKHIDMPMTILLHSFDLSKLKFICGSSDFEKASQTVKFINIFFIFKAAIIQISIVTL